MDGVEPVGNAPPRPIGPILSHLVPDWILKPPEYFSWRLRFQFVVQLVGGLLKPRVEQSLILCLSEEWPCDA
eukprot:7321196-Pyramimonas_sp.AAC.1